MNEETIKKDRQEFLENERSLYDFFKDPKIKNIHFVGIGGISMSAIAQVLLSKGYHITGSDMFDSKQVQICISKGIDVTVGSNIDNVLKADLVIYTAAIAFDDVELVCARENNIPCIERSKALGLITKEYTNSIGISGTHGKTTTTSMLSSIMLGANLDPSIHVGAFLKQIESNYKIGKSQYFIYESCEYKDSFLDFFPQTQVILNIEYDHVDYFKTFEQMIRSFEKLVQTIKKDGNLVISLESEQSQRIVDYAKAAREDVSIITYGTEDARYYAKDVSYNEFGFPSFTIHDNENDCDCIRLTLAQYGKHNIQNAICAYAISKIYGISDEDIQKGLLSFEGSSRRFEYKGTTLNGAKVYDDYAHHPQEIDSIAQAIANISKDNVYAIFEAHTYSRLKSLKDDFAKSLLPFDNIIITGIYPAREAFDPEITEEMLKEKILSLDGNKKVVVLKEKEDIDKYIQENAQKEDIVITLGAGNVTHIASLVAKQS